MPKVLKLSPYCFPEQVSSTHMSEDLNKAMYDAGFVYENFVPTPSRGISKEDRKKYKKIKYEERDGGHLMIHRFPMFAEGKNPALRAIRYVLVNLKQYRRGSRAKDIDIIYSASTPPTQGYLCARVKKKLNKRYKKQGKYVPFVFNLQDIFPDSLVNAGMTKKGSLLWKLGRRIESFAYENADRIITISDGFKANVMAKGVPEEKIVVIPNWVDSSRVYPVPREENVLFERLGLPRERFYICYSGNIGHSQNLGLLLDTAKRLETSLPAACFVLIGEGAAKEEFEAEVKDAGLDNIALFPFQPYEDIAHVFSLGDVGLVISKPGVGTSSVPSKTWSIMAAARPVLASFDEDSELSRLVETVGCGVLSPGGGGAEQLEKTILRLHADRAALAETGKRGREYVVTELDRDKCVARYIETVTGVLEGLKK